MNLLYAQDLEKLVGTTTDLGTYTPTGDELAEFANQWDPQPFHTDARSAAQGFFGEIIASGMLTLAIFQRLSVLAVYRNWAVLAGRRMTNVEFISPVIADVNLWGSLIIDRVAHLRSDRSLVYTRGELAADGEKVMTVALETYVLREPSQGSR